MPIPVINQPEQAIAVAALIAQFLKELGIPSPGVTQSAIVYAGYQLTLNNPVGFLIIGAVFIGFIAGSATAYAIGRFFGSHLVNKLVGRLSLNPEYLEQAKNKIMKRTHWAVIIGRFIPIMMLPLSVAAGTVRLPLPAFYRATGLAMMLWASFFAVLGVVFEDAINKLALTFNLPLILGTAVISVAIVGVGLLVWRRLPHTTDS